MQNFTKAQTLQLLRDILVYLEAQAESQRYDASPDDAAILADELRLYLTEE